MYQEAPVNALAILEQDYEQYGAIHFAEEEHCLRPSLLRTGVVTRAERHFINCLDEVCDRRVRRLAELAYRMQLPFTGMSGPIAKRPPIRVRFGSDIAFYYSFELAKGKGKGKDSEDSKVFVKGKGKGQIVEDSGDFGPVSLGVAASSSGAARSAFVGDFPPQQQCSVQ